MDRFLPPENVRRQIVANKKMEDVGKNFEVTADTLADGLGVKPSGFLGSMGFPEGFKLNATNGLINMMGKHYSEEQQYGVVSEFAAKYLPATVDRFLDPPSLAEYSDDVRQELLLHNAYYRVIFIIQHTPYFYKYLRSQKPIAANNKRLPKALAERLLALASTWDHYFDHPPKDEPGMGYKHLAGDVIFLLTTVLVAAAKDNNQEKILPADVRNELLPWLRKWTTRYSHLEFGMVADRLARILSGDKAFIDQRVLHVRRKMKNWDTCAMHGCEKKEGLKACARCHTVQYCSPAHQKEHWKYPDIKMPLVGHKKHCFKTDY